MKLHLTLFLLLLSPLTQAHYVWLEKGLDGAKLYFGEWHQDEREGPEKLQRFKDAKIFTSEPSNASTLSVQSNHLLAKTVGEGDARMRLDSLPAKESRSGEVGKSHYYAKTGRTETQAKLPLELVPTTSNGNAFTLLLNQEALAGADIVVYGPPKWEKRLRTDKAGKVSFDTPWIGQYLVKVSHAIPPKTGKATLDNPVIRYVYTGTFLVKKGIEWDK